MTLMLSSWMNALRRPFPVIAAAAAAAITMLATPARSGPSNYTSAADELVTVAGLAQTPGAADGSGSTARFNQPWDVVVDGSGTAYVTDTSSHRIRKISTDGAVSHYAGDPSGLASGNADGSLTQARFSSPIGIALDGTGNLYVADSGNGAVRKISQQGQVSTVASIPNPTGIAYHPGDDDLYVTSILAGTITVIDLGPNTTNVLATGLSGPAAIDITQNNSGVLFTEQSSNRIRRLQGSAVSVYSGNGLYGLANGNATTSRFAGPNGLVVISADNVLVGDTGNAAIRLVLGGNSSTYAGTGVVGSSDGPRSSATLRSPYGIDIAPDGALWIADRDNHTVRRVLPDPPLSVPSRPTHVTTTTTTTSSSTTTSTTSTTTAVATTAAATTVATTATPTNPTTPSLPSATPVTTAAPSSTTTTSAATSTPTTAAVTTPSTTTTLATTTRPALPSTTTAARPRLRNKPKAGERCKYSTGRFSEYSVVELWTAPALVPGKPATPGRLIGIYILGGSKEICVLDQPPGSYRLIGPAYVNRGGVRQKVIGALRFTI
jgi:sugar lactone lactonase YvrE